MCYKTPAATARARESVHSIQIHTFYYSNKKIMNINILTREKKATARAHTALSRYIISNVNRPKVNKQHLARRFFSQPNVSVCVLCLFRNTPIGTSKVVLCAVVHNRNVFGVFEFCLLPWICFSKYVRNDDSQRDAWMWVTYTHIRFSPFSGGCAKAFRFDRALHKQKDFVSTKIEFRSAHFWLNSRTNF